MDLPTFLSQSPDLGDPASATKLATRWTSALARKGTIIAVQGEPETHEYIVLDGRVASCIIDAEGRAVCVGMYVGPCVVTPQVARSNEGISLVSIEAKTDALVARLDSAALTTLMLENEPIRDWANDVLRRELSRKADREWCLAALGGAERLIWFRERYPGYEQQFSHSLIASFIGITPVTFSRLRNSV
jgi:CRP-like cAMP-binding protein